jgi:hypothetical protein
VRRLPPQTDCSVCEYRFPCYTTKLPFCVKDDIWLHDGKLVLNGIPASEWKSYEFLVEGKRRKLTDEEWQFISTAAIEALWDGKLGRCSPIGRGDSLKSCTVWVRNPPPTQL